MHIRDKSHSKITSASALTHLKNAGNSGAQPHSMVDFSQSKGLGTWQSFVDHQDLSWVAERSAGELIAPGARGGLGMYGHIPAKLTKRKRHSRLHAGWTRLVHLSTSDSGQNQAKHQVENLGDGHRPKIAIPTTGSKRKKCFRFFHFLPHTAKHLIY